MDSGQNPVVPRLGVDFFYQHIKIQKHKKLHVTEAI